NPFLMLAMSLCDLAQIADPRRWNDMDLLAVLLRRHILRNQFPFAYFLQFLHESAVKLIGSRVIELAGYSAIYGHEAPVFLEPFMIALKLLFHIPQCIGSTPLVELIDGHQVCKVQHVNL